MNDKFFHVLIFLKVDNKDIAHHILTPNVATDCVPQPIEATPEKIQFKYLPPLRVERGDLVVVWTKRPSIGIKVNELHQPYLRYYQWNSGTEHFKTQVNRYQQQTVGMRTAGLLEQLGIDPSAVKAILSQFNLFEFAHKAPTALDPHNAFRFLMLETCLEGVDAICVRNSKQIKGLSQMLIDLQKLSIQEDLDLPAIIVLDPCSQYGLAALAQTVLEEKTNGTLKKMDV